MVQFELALLCLFGRARDQLLSLLTALQSLVLTETTVVMV